ncbi:E6 [Leptonychotes weddellii papillomavirus 3]|uniref:Protein E6 n=1 Tax=Leptonychotes weddellii papillomavirus 3 TaxID=2077304 RepID=A0A2I8B2R0_9PAPI|nr:E6 [Leptonychotes weddellii papillomavirus 3]AUT11911.1 E6 [Leptonychotes weddellii papillomavirus 3]
MGRALNLQSMARPTTIAELADSCGIPLVDVVLPCVFCKKYLNFQERCSFDEKNLQLSWKDSRAYGCCSHCARVTAWYEWSTFYQGSLTARELLTVYGRNALTLVIRCFKCLRKLSCTEVCAALGGGQYFDLVRGRWKAQCKFCAGR